MNQANSTEASSGGSGGWSPARIRAIALGLLIGLGICLCYCLARPCIPSLVWAGALTLIFAPLQRWMETRITSTNLAAAFSMAIIGLLVVVPTTFFAQMLVEQAITVPQNVQKQIAAGKWHVVGDEHPLMAHVLTWAEQEVSSPENASEATSWGKTMVSRLVKESALAAIQVCVTLYFLFYFLRDRVRVLKAIRRFLPLSESESDALFSRINDTVHAILHGMIALSVVQGFLAGLMFWWLGVPSPWFWATVAALFAFVPILDALVLWLPAAVYLALEGRWEEAIGIAALTTLLVRGIENVLYPILVKNRMKVHPVSIFVSVVGGLILFGWSGLVLGPVILTATSALLGIRAKRLGEPKIGIQRAEPVSTKSIKSTGAVPTSQPV